MAERDDVQQAMLVTAWRSTSKQVRLPGCFCAAY